MGAVSRCFPDQGTRLVDRSLQVQKNRRDVGCGYFISGVGIHSPPGSPWALAGTRKVDWIFEYTANPCLSQDAVRPRRCLNLLLSQPLFSICTRGMQSLRIAFNPGLPLSLRACLSQDPAWFAPRRPPHLFATQLPDTDRCDRPAPRLPQNVALLQLPGGQTY